MKIIVLIAGVQDPKWAISPTGGNLPEAQADRQIMSPFDEAALEMALRLRDADPDSDLHVFVTGGEAGGKIARAVAAFKPTEVSTVQLDTLWNQATVAKTLAKICADCDLVLIGREFGDLDDGLVAPMIARLLDAGFFGRAQVVDAKGTARLMRENGGFEEWCTLSGQLVASVTNDRRTRLRKPLMKNVMLARHMVIGRTNVTESASAGIRIVHVSERTASRAATACHMIEGTNEQKAQALASFLLAARA